MIKIFTKPEHSDVVHGWMQTNIISTLVEDANAATALGITSLPALVETDGTNIITNYAQGMKEFMDLSPEVMDEIRSKV